MTLLKLKVKGSDIALNGTPISELRSVTCRMGSHIRAYDSNFRFDIWRVTNADYLLTYLVLPATQHR